MLKVGDLVTVNSDQFDLENVQGKVVRICRFKRSLTTLFLVHVDCSCYTILPSEIEGAEYV